MVWRLYQLSRGQNARFLKNRPWVLSTISVLRNLGEIFHISPSRVYFLSKSRATVFRVRTKDKKYGKVNSNTLSPLENIRFSSTWYFSVQSTNLCKHLFRDKVYGNERNYVIGIPNSSEIPRDEGRRGEEGGGLYFPYRAIINYEYRHCGKVERSLFGGLLPRTRGHSPRSRAKSSALACRNSIATVPIKRAARQVPFVLRASPRATHALPDYTTVYPTPL